jgi:GNAT superfamily N-acetyltransferase
MITVRQASPEDAEAVVDVVRESITLLCAKDHRDDPYTLAKWLENKTVRHFVAWQSNSDNFCVVAHLDGRLLGVGLLHRSGEIRLFFLAPGAQRQGLGTAIHDALEDKAKAWGMRALHLQSTVMACRFYEALGYQPNGAAIVRFGVLQCYPYEKLLQSDHSFGRTASDQLH